MNPILKNYSGEKLVTKPTSSWIGIPDGFHWVHTQTESSLVSKNDTLLHVTENDSTMSFQNCKIRFVSSANINYIQSLTPNGTFLRFSPYYSTNRIFEIQSNTVLVGDENYKVDFVLNGKKIFDIKDEVMRLESVSLEEKVNGILDILKNMSS